jgi:hypothetical protein
MIGGVHSDWFPLQNLQIYTVISIYPCGECLLTVLGAHNSTSK